MNILITGASRGIGRAVAIEFAKNNHNIIICAKSDLEGLQNTKRLVENEGVSCYIGLCNVTNEDSVKKFISDSAKAIGKTDILINNAGISYIGLLQDMSFEDWNKVLSTNLTSEMQM